MNSFEQNEKIRQELAQTIKNLQIIVNRNEPFSTIEKDILLQCLRNLYLLTLQYHPQNKIHYEGEMTSSDKKNDFSDLNHTEKEEKAKTPDEVPHLQEDIVVEEPLFDDFLSEETTAEKTEEEKIEQNAELSMEEMPATEKEEEISKSPIPSAESIEAPEDIIDFLAPQPTIKEEPTLADISKEEKEQKNVSTPEKNTAADAKPALLFGEEELQKATQPAAKRSLNDLLNEQKKDNSIANKFRQSRVEDLSKAISLNDKFLFIKELFQNKGGDFSNAIQTLNKCETMEDAMDEIELLIKYYGWDTSTESYLSFCDLVKRKFQ